MRNAGRRSDVAATTWSTSATPNRSATPSWPSPGRYSGARAHWSRTNRSGSPTQRRSALPVAAVGIATTGAAVRDIGSVGIGPVRVAAVRVTTGGVGGVGGVAPRPGGAASRGGDVVVPEGWVVSAHREASSEGPGRTLVGGWACHSNGNATTGLHGGQGRGPARRGVPRPSVVRLELEGDADLGPVGGNPPVLDHHVELGDLGDAQVTERLGGRLDSQGGGLLPRLGAGPHDLGESVHAVRHRTPFRSVTGD